MNYFQNFIDFANFSIGNKEMSFEEIEDFFKRTKLIPKLQKLLWSGVQKEKITNQSLRDYSWDSVNYLETKLLNNMLLHGVASSLMLYPCIDGDMKAIPVWALNYFLYLIQCYNISRIESLKNQSISKKRNIN